MKHLGTLHNCICANAQGAHAKIPFVFSVPLRKVLLVACKQLVSLLIPVSPLSKVLWAAPFGSPISGAGMCWGECVPADPWGKVAEGEGKPESCSTYMCSGLKAPLHNDISLAINTQNIMIFNKTGSHTTHPFVS